METKKQELPLHLLAGALLVISGVFSLIYGMILFGDIYFSDIAYLIIAIVVAIFLFVGKSTPFMAIPLLAMFGLNFLFSIVNLIDLAELYIRWIYRYEDPEDVFSLLQLFAEVISALSWFLLATMTLVMNLKDAESFRPFVKKTWWLPAVLQIPAFMFVLGFAFVKLLYSIEYFFETLYVVPCFFVLVACFSLGKWLVSVQTEKTTVAVAEPVFVSDAVSISYTDEVPVQVQTAATPIIVQQQTSAADELKKYKELLDMGAITQEEFDAKKKQILNL